MIRALRIQGFRSLRDVTWAPGRLNVVIGPNGAGKSNLLRALALLQRAAVGNLTLEILRLGGIAPLLWDGEAQALEWTLETDPLDESRDEQREALAYELRLRRLGKTSAYRIDHELLGNCSRAGTGEKTEPKKYLERRPGHAVTLDFQDRELVAHEGSVPDDETLLSMTAGPFASSNVLRFRNLVTAWGIYHDLHVDSSAELRQAAVARLEKRVAADGQNLVPVLHSLYTSDRDFKHSLDEAMRAAFGSDFEELSFPPAADQRVQLRVRWKSLKTAQSAADLSDGTIRFLLLLAILANPEPDALIAIDEPETGLHPSMLPIIAEFAREASTRSQVILTTHSPQLLDAFGREAPTVTVARWVDGETQLRNVDAEELQRWLAEYSLGSLARSGELEELP